MLRPACISCSGFNLKHEEDVELDAAAAGGTLLLRSDSHSLFDYAFISPIIVFLSLFVYSLSGVFLAPFWTVKHNKLVLTGPSVSVRL